MSNERGVNNSALTIATILALGSIDDKVDYKTSAKTEIDKAISKQYDNRITFEIKPAIYGSEKKPIGTDGAYEHQYAKDQGLKVDYSKLWEHMGQKKEFKQDTEKIQEKPTQVEERRGELEVKEMMETMDEMYVESSIRSGGSHVSYDRKEGMDYALQTSPHKLVWFKFWEQSSPYRTSNTNFSVHNLLL